MLKNIFITLGLIVVPLLTFAQPQIISLLPSSALPGERVNVIVQCENTHLEQGVTTITFGEGIEIDGLFVNTPELLTVNIIVLEKASTGSRNIEITTNNEIVNTEGVFEVMSQENSLNVNIDVIPVQTLHVSDFDATQIQNAPLMFNILVYNDQTQRRIQLKMLVNHQVHGLLVTLTKNTSDLAPLQVLKVDNKQFDDYEINESSDVLINETMKTGLLPAGMYTYQIMVLDEGGEIIASDEDNNTTTNEVAAIELIIPGNPVGEMPQVTQSEFPFFQWISNSNKFDFILYEVFEGQKGEEDIANNLPVYEEKGLSSPSFLYPNSAEVLQKGKTYSWQVKAYFLSSHGEQVNNSTLYWFTLKELGPGLNVNLDRIEVSPSEISISSGHKFLFTAKAFSLDNLPVDVEFEWKVVPKEAGNIDQNGVFIAGKKPMAAAIVASYGDKVQYSVIEIKWSKEMLELNPFNGILKKLFGLPESN